MGTGKKIFKRGYESKLVKRAVKNRENRRFIVEHLKREWEEAERLVERDARKLRRRETLKETGTVLGLTILGMAAVCGILIVGAVAPNIFSAFGRLGKHRRYFHRKDFENKITYFKRRGYVSVVKTEDETREVRLTKLGQEQLAKRAFWGLKVLRPEKWDGIWRLVFFDVPEGDKWARDGLRRCLKNMGFCPLQKSTFVFPYPCREEIEFLRRLYDLGGHLRYVETRVINFDDDLKEFFGLKK